MNMATIPNKLVQTESVLSAEFFPEGNVSKVVPVLN
jgi:hypothetical protein